MGEGEEELADIATDADGMVFTRNGRDFMLVGWCECIVCVVECSWNAGRDRLGTKNGREVRLEHKQSLAHNPSLVTR